MKNIFVYSIVLLCIIIFNNAPAAQENRKVELNAQGILARVDRIFDYPQGMMKGLMKHIRPDGTSMTVSFSGFISRDDYLFVYSTRERGDQLKVLYTLRGEDIWVYNTHALKLFHKLGIDRYDPILATNFSFIDLSNADFQSNYTATVTGEAFVKGVDAYTLRLDPIVRGEYGMLTMYVAKDRFIPLRIDFHDRDKAIFKFMTIVKIKENDKRIVPLRYDMMNIRQGTVTIVSFSEFDEAAAFDKKIFRPEKLGE